MRKLRILKAGPSLSVQDQGRSGYIAFGLSKGGAADRLALVEGAALLNQPLSYPAIEMASFGGEFQADEDIRIALTGAPMKASLDGVALTWNASHLLPKGTRLSIGAPIAGVYGYLNVGGGIDTDPILGAQSTHFAAGIGQRLLEGDSLPIGADFHQEVGYGLDLEQRFSGGLIRVVESLQTEFFSKDQIDQLQNFPFQRDIRGNRMGVRLISDGSKFESDRGLRILSEIVTPGDIQIAGDGSPFVLLYECQTTGGYPRIATVIPADLPKVVQAGPGTNLRFEFIPLEEAYRIERAEAARRASLKSLCRPLIRDPHDITNLLSYQLVDGVSRGDELEEGV